MFACSTLTSPVFWVFFPLLLFSVCGEMFLNALNAKRMRSKTPLAGYFIEKDRLENIGSWLDVLFWGLLLPGGLFPVYSAFLEKAIPSTGEKIASTLFFAGFFFLRFLLQIPPAFRKTILSEREYGYGHTSMAQFFADQGKCLLLGGFFSGSAGFLLVFLLKKAGQTACLLYFPLSALLFLLAADFFAPYILRLFFQVKNPEDPILEKEAEAILSRGGFRMKELKILNFSSRTNHANAFLSGTGCSRKIFLSDTLKKILTREELLAVIAHEMAHGVGRHREKLFAIQAAGLILILPLCSLMLKDFWIFQQFYPEVSSSVSASTLNPDPGTLPPFVFETEILLCLFVLESTIWVLLPLFNLFCRHCEFEADRMASDSCGGPEKLISALRKLLNDPLPEGVHPLYKAFKCRHPSFSEREALLLKLEKRNHGRSPEITGGDRFP